MWHLLSIFATTVSIALTFGTAAVVNHYKKQSEKREIVMMAADSSFNEVLQLQKTIDQARAKLKLE